jgi:hypothetical protein
MKTALLILVSFLIGSASMAAPEAKGPGPYRHVVLFKFKDTATKAQITHIEKEFATLPQKINTITGYEWGTDVTPNNKAQGFTHCFIVTFKNKAGLDVYLPHAAHQAFVKELLPILDKVLVIDFVAR